MGLPARHRLKRQADFRTVYRQGHCYNSSVLIVRFLLVETRSFDEPIPTKIGISVSRKVCKKAVVRNKLKRLVKAVFIELLPQIPPNYLIVVNLKPTAQRCKYGHFLRELKDMLLKMGIVNGN